MAPSPKKVVFLFLALSLMIAAVHGSCGRHCPTQSPPPPPSSSSPPPPPSSSSPPPPPVSSSPPPTSSSSPPPSSTNDTCPINTLKLSVCANVLNLLKLKLGLPGSKQCCPLLAGVAELDAAVCLCTAIRPINLGVINLDVPLAINLLLNPCGKTRPPGFTCPT
ncbi:unnamed protein product [Alopecurus aequalis]